MDYYWTTKDGKKINVDDMSESHLRNVLKLIMRRAKNKIETQTANEILESENDLEPYHEDFMWK